MSDYGNYGQYGDQGGFNQMGNDDFLNDGGGSQKPALRSSLTPVTIKQINESTQPVPDSDFQVNGVELNMVSFIGAVRKVDNLQSAVTVTVEDGTGSIDIRRWIDNETVSADEEGSKYESLINKYVLVTGALKLFNDRKNIQNSTIKEITDHNQITYHNLSAISIHLKAQGISNDNKNQLFVSEMGSQTTSESEPDRILRVIKEHSVSMNEGVPVQLIAQMLNITDDVVLGHCQSLSESGRIYTGYDDHAFLSV